MNISFSRAILAAVTGAFVMTACSDATGTGHVKSNGLAYVRIVNALYMGDADSTSSPVAIDYFVDSSTAAPGVANLAANSMTVGDSANGYSPIPPGIVSFNGRRTGDTRFFYTANGTDKPFFPKLALTAGRYHTVLVTGRIPSTGDIPAGSVEFHLLDDDNFPGATFGGTVQARMILYNAAAYAGDLTLRFYLTQGTAPANLLADYQPTGRFVFLGCAFGCNYVDVKPGTYTLTVAQQSDTVVLGRQQVTFAEGDVVTAILQSSSYAAVPSTTNHILRVIHDHPHP